MQNSLFFGSVLATSANFVSLDMSKWLKGPLNVELSSDLESLQGQKSTKRAISYDPMTLGYRIMITSISGKWPSWIWQIWWPQ